MTDDTNCPLTEVQKSGASRSPQRILSCFFLISKKLNININNMLEMESGGKEGGRAEGDNT